MPTNAMRVASTCLVLATILLLLAGRVWLIPAHFSTDPNEGWNAFQASRALGAGPLYPSLLAFIGNNYPPLSFFIVGWLGSLIDDNIIAGRIVALCSVLVVSGLVFVAVRMMSRSIAEPLIGVFLFLGFNVTLFRSYVAMDDPQWLGHGFMMVGICLMLVCHDDEPITTVIIVVAALFMLAGGFIKHNLVAFPLAATAWLAIHDRRALSAWMLTSALVLATATTLLYRAYGIAFFTDLLAVDRHCSGLRSASRSAGPVALLLPMIVVSSSLWRDRKTDRRVDLLLLMVALGLLFGVLERSGQGVDRNAHFEALIALCIATAVSLGRETPARKLSLRKLAWLMLPFGVMLPTALRSDIDELLHRGDRQKSWNVMQDRVAAIAGRVACENPAFCYWAGKSFEVDFFLYGQHLARRRDTTAIVNALAGHDFRAIELDRDPGHPSLGDIRNPLHALIPRFYRSAFVDVEGRRLLEPTSQTASSPPPRS